MAKPPPTHLIEIETGQAEPAAIPLAMGTELQPISIGKQGMWRIEQPSLLDVHAFVYFDGTTLFIQSAEDGASVSVDGYRIGKAWTELHSPCRIELGTTRLRFRSVDDVPPEPPKPVSPRDLNLTGPRQATPPSSKPERPFRPGELATGGDAEDTATRALPERSVPDSSSTPQPAAGREAIDETRMEGTGGSGRRDRTLALTSEAVAQARASAMPPPMHPGMQQQPPPHMQMQMQPHMQMPMQQPPMPQGRLPPAMSSGVQAHASGPYAQPQYPSQPPGPRTSGFPSAAPPRMTAGGYTNDPGPPEGGFAYYLARFNDLSLPKRILIILAPFCLIASGYLILFDDPSAQRSARGFGGAVAAPSPPPTIATAGTMTSSAVTSTCPAGFVPYGTPAPGTAVQCVPGGALSVPAGAIADAGAVAAVADAGPPKTLERQAVDFVAANDYAHAAAVYEQLQAQNPQNRVYAEAARILRAKADAGAPR